MTIMKRWSTYSAVLIMLGIALMGCTTLLPMTTGELSFYQEKGDVGRLLVMVQCRSELDACRDEIISTTENEVARLFERRGYSIARASHTTLDGIEKTSVGAEFESTVFDFSFLGGVQKGGIAFSELSPNEQKMLLSAAEADAVLEVTVTEEPLVFTNQHGPFNKQGYYPVEIQLRLGQGALGKDTMWVSYCQSHRTTSNAYVKPKRGTQAAIKDGLKCAVDKLQHAQH